MHQLNDDVEEYGHTIEQMKQEKFNSRMSLSNLFRQTVQKLDTYYEHKLKETLDTDTREASVVQESLKEELKENVEKVEHIIELHQKLYDRRGQMKKIYQLMESKNGIYCEMIEAILQQTDEERKRSEDKERIMELLRTDLETKRAEKEEKERNEAFYQEQTNQLEYLREEIDHLKRSVFQTLESQVREVDEVATRLDRKAVNKMISSQGRFSMDEELRAILIEKQRVRLQKGEKLKRKRTKNHLGIQKGVSRSSKLKTTKSTLASLPSILPSSPSLTSLNAQTHSWTIESMWMREDANSSSSNSSSNLLDKLRQSASHSSLI